MNHHPGIETEVLLRSGKAGNFPTERPVRGIAKERSSQDFIWHGDLASPKDAFGKAGRPVSCILTLIVSVEQEETP